MCAIFSLVYGLSIIVPKASGEVFFLVESSWSLLVIMLILSVQVNWVTLVICIFELLHISSILIVCYVYIGGDFQENLFYVNYENNQAILNSIEAAVLIAGVPWSAITNRIAYLFSNDASSRAANNRNIQSD